jgi:hypothetical protein
VVTLRIDTNSVTPLFTLWFSNHLSIFPNPNNGKFRLIAELPDKEPLIIAVYNAPGQEVYKETVRETQALYHEIDLSNIATGIYTVQVKSGIHIVSKKLLIQQ